MTICQAFLVTFLNAEGKTSSSFIRFIVCLKTVIRKESIVVVSKTLRYRTTVQEAQSVLV